MNRKAQLGELNMSFVALALAAGAIAFFITTRVEVNALIKILSAIGATVLTYIYLMMTDR